MDSSIASTSYGTPSTMTMTATEALTATLLMLRNKNASNSQFNLGDNNFIFPSTNCLYSCLYNKQQFFVPETTTSMAPIVEKPAEAALAALFLSAQSKSANVGNGISTFVENNLDKEGNLFSALHQQTTQYSASHFPQNATNPQLSSNVLHNLSEVQRLRNLHALYCEFSR